MITVEIHTNQPGKCIWCGKETDEFIKEAGDRWWSVRAVRHFRFLGHDSVIPLKDFARRIPTAPAFFRQWQPVRMRTEVHLMTLDFNIPGVAFGFEERLRMMWHRHEPPVQTGRKARGSPVDAWRLTGGPTSRTSFRTNTARRISDRRKSLRYILPLIGLEPITR